MFYDDEHGDYYEQEEDAYLHWWDQDLKPPEFLYGTKPVVLKEKLGEIWAQQIIEYIESDVPEANVEDSYFGEMLTPEERKQMQAEILAVAQKYIKTVEPDYEVKHPTAEGFAKFVAEQEEET